MQPGITRITSAQARMLGLRLERRAAALGQSGRGAELAEIEDALARIEAGTYGSCTCCGAPLPLRYLDAAPQAKRCAHCEESTGKART